MTATLFSSIVCSVDFSDHSVRALRHAIALAGHVLGRVTVIHVANPLLVQAAKAAYDVAAINRETETELRALVDDVATEAGAWAPEVRTIISVGDPATEIIKCAEEDDADMIVMGTHGRSGYRKMFFGSVTEQVLRRSPVPVFAVPASDHERVTFTDKGPRFSSGPILAPTDLSAQSLVNTQVAHSLSVSFAAPLLACPCDRACPGHWPQASIDRGSQEGGRRGCARTTSNIRIRDRPRRAGGDSSRCRVPRRQNRGRRC